MADLIFKGELPLAEITDEEAEDFFLKLFKENPDALPEKWRQAALQYAIIRGQADRIKERVDADERKAKFEKWTRLFFETRKSARTRAVYEAAFARLKAFCAREGIELSAIEYDQAVEFTLSDELRMGARGKRGEQSIRLDISAVSSLYSELDRMSKGKIRNPFLRLQTKPGKKRDGDKAVPTAEELEKILANTRGEVRAAIACMAFRGFRIGALPELELATRDGKTGFSTFTKGKAQKAAADSERELPMPQAAMDAIDEAGLSRKTPFAAQSVDNLKMRIQRDLDRLASEGLIAGHAAERKVKGKARQVTVSDYSCHSFRHFYAVSLYKETKDVELVRRALNHADLNTTQVYLQSLGVDC